MSILIIYSHVKDNNLLICLKLTLDRLVFTVHNPNKDDLSNIITEAITQKIGWKTGLQFEIKVIKKFTKNKLLRLNRIYAKHIWRQQGNIT